MFFFLWVYINIDNFFFVGVIVWVVGVMNEFFFCILVILVVLFVELGIFSFVFKCVDFVCFIFVIFEYDFYCIKIVWFLEDDLWFVIMDIGCYDVS